MLCNIIIWERQWNSRYQKCTTYRFEIPVFLFGPVASCTPEPYALSWRVASPFLAAFDDDPPPGRLLNPCFVVFFPIGFFDSRKLEKSNLFSSSSSYLRLRSSSSFCQRSFSILSLSWISSSKAANLGAKVFLSYSRTTSVFSVASATS